VDEVSGLLTDILNSGPIDGLDESQIPALVEALAPILRDIVATELSMAADEVGVAVENPEASKWGQGVMDVAAYLRACGDAVARGEERPEFRS